MNRSLTAVALAALALTPGGAAQDGGADRDDAVRDVFTELLESELVLREVWQGEIAMTDYYPLDYVMTARHEVSVSARPGAEGSDDRRLVTYDRVDGARTFESSEETGEEAVLESELNGAVVAFGRGDERRLVKGSAEVEPLLPALRDDFERRAFAPPADLGDDPGWTVRDAEALSLFDATGDLGRRLEALTEPQQTVQVLGAPFELPALLRGTPEPTAELVLKREEPGGPVDPNEPLALTLEASGVGDLLPHLRLVAELAGADDLWDGVTKLEATWSLEAKGEAMWDARRRALHAVELEGDLVVSAELTYQPRDRSLSPNTFVLDVAGTVTYVSDHWRE